VDSKAPYFNSVDDQGNTITLDQFKGKTLILFFYPKDFTPGCTLEACGFKDIYNSVFEQNVDIVGVSKDDIKSHQEFKKLFNIPYLLIADSIGEVCKAYDVIREKSMMGKKYRGIERSTFLINDQGYIVKAWRNVNAAGHVPAVHAALKELKL